MTTRTSDAVLTELASAYTAARFGVAVVLRTWMHNAYESLITHPLHVADSCARAAEVLVRAYSVSVCAFRQLCHGSSDCVVGVRLANLSIVKLVSTVLNVVGYVCLPVFIAIIAVITRRRSAFDKCRTSGRVFSEKAPFGAKCSNAGRRCQTLRVPHRSVYYCVLRGEAALWS
jgi:hypothetical protein